MSASRARLGDRALFGDLEARAYLSHSSISPFSTPVREALVAIADDYACGGMAGFQRWRPQRERLKGDLARLIGASAEEIAFVQSTTSGVIHIAFGMSWNAGDRVVLFEGEFPANITPWQRAAETFGLELVFLPLDPFTRSKEEGLKRLRSELTKGARLVALSAVQFQTGLRMPVAEIGALCRELGAELFVDAIQGLGAVPIDVEAIDYLSAGGHKFLMGPEGAGMMYIRKQRVSGLVPRLAGWLSHESALDFLFRGPGHLRYDRPIRQTADFVEQGVASSLGYAGLGASVELLMQLGPRSIYEHLQRYHDALEPGLVERGFRSLRAPYAEGRSAVLSVLPPQGIAVPDLHRELVERGIEVSIPDGCLRFAPHWPNSLDEVPIVVEAMDRALERLRA